MTASRPDLPVSAPTLYRWIKAGLIRLDLCGNGPRLRPYPPAEVRAVRAVHAATRIAGAGAAWTPAGVAFLTAVAEVARSNPPGTAHEIATPCPYVRHIVIVPEP